MKKIDYVIGAICTLGLLAAIGVTAHDIGYDEGFNDARYACPKQQNGERLRFVEQPLNAERVVCVYARVAASANRRVQP